MSLLARLGKGEGGGLIGVCWGGEDVDLRDIRAPIVVQTRTHRRADRLNDPQFVGSFETEDHVYFCFANQPSSTSIAARKSTSRIARVCKNDRGG